MSVLTEAPLNLNIYDEVLNDETTSDHSSEALNKVPELTNKMLCVLYLQNNNITSLPEDFFPSLPMLMWLDLRDNLLTDIPTTIKNHPSLTHLLLQNNKLTALPNELGSVVKLKVLQLNGNPLMYPPREIIKAGVSKIVEFLHGKLMENIFVSSQSDFSDAGSVSGRHYETLSSQDVMSYNSVLDEDKLKKPKMTIEFNEKESEDSEEEYYAKFKGKCPKLARSRHKTLPTYFQSAKYVKTMSTHSQLVQNERIRQSCFKDATIKKHKEMLSRIDKVLQERKLVPS